MSRTAPSTPWEKMRGILARVAVGPSGSRDLDEAEAYDAMTLCLGDGVSDIQKAVFLIAERLKRETLDENAGFLRALIDASHVVTVDRSHVLSLCDPYDGFNRVPHFAPVVAAVLGACGLPTYVHGAESMAPKHGITHRAVFQAKGFKLDIGRGLGSVEAAAQRLVRNGAAYVDVEDFCPSLASLGPLRREIAKRPCLATLEKLISPLRGASRTSLCVGWVHKGYDDTIVALAERVGFHRTLMVKGREGHVDPSVAKDTAVLMASAGEMPRREHLQPKSYGLLVSQPEDQGELTPAGVAELWDRALSRKHRSLPAQTVRLLAGTLLAHCGLASTIMRGVGLAHEAIDSGRASEVLAGVADA